MSAPLAGRRILDLSGRCSSWPLALAVAMATRVCSDYGAEVDRPTDADTDVLTRAEPLLPDGRSAVDVFLNDGKRGIPLDQDAQWAAGYDAAVGDTAALDRYARSVPVHARITTLAPGRDDPATELSILALSGLLTALREPGGPPVRLAGHQLAYAAGTATGTGLLAALFQSVGQVVDVSLLDVAVWLNWKMPAGMLAMGDSGERGSNPRNHWVTMAAADGWIALVYQEKNWPAIRDMIGDPRLAEPRFADMISRGTRWAELADIVGPWFRARSRAEITAQAQRRHVPIGPVLDPVELLGDAQHTARGLIADDGRPHLPLVWDGTRVGA